MNRKIILSLLLILSASAQLLARDDGRHAVVLNGREQHSEHYTPADMPEVYYDSDNQQGRERDKILGKALHLQ